MLTFMFFAFALQSPTPISQLAFAMKILLFLDGGIAAIEGFFQKQHFIRNVKHNRIAATEGLFPHLLQCHGAVRKVPVSW